MGNMMAVTAPSEEPLITRDRKRLFSPSSVDNGVTKRRLHFDNDDQFVPTGQHTMPTNVIKTPRPVMSRNMPASFAAPPSPGTLDCVPDSDIIGNAEMSYLQDVEAISWKMDEIELEKKLKADVPLLRKTHDPQGDMNALFSVCKQQQALSTDLLWGTLFEGQDLNKLELYKLGTGSYSEVFKMSDDSVLKVCPFVIPKIGEGGAKLKHKQKGPPISDILAEASCAAALDSADAASESAEDSILRKVEDLGVLMLKNFFPKVQIMKVFRGRLPVQFYEAWRLWRQQCSPSSVADTKIMNLMAENAPDVNHTEQYYYVIKSKYAGEPLHEWQFKNPSQVDSMLLQVCLGLAQAEESCDFEHRDLHSGNVLVRKTGAQEGSHISAVIHGKNVQLAHSGICVTIIDFTFSRMESQTPGVAPIYTDLALGGSPISADDHVAKKLGWSDPRGLHYNVYAQMQDLTKGNWSLYTPRSNVLWLQYLIEALMEEGTVRGSMKTLEGNLPEWRALQKRLRAVGSAQKALQDPFFVRLCPALAAI